jgi:glycerol-3-phosphate O-acyltransferase / dihydroxyacetone phosphate acyltransferase
MKSNNPGKSSGFLFTFGKFFLPWQMGNQFRRINLNGMERIPRDTPVLIAANHPTAFVDPVILGTYSKPPLYFMTRGDLFSNPTAKRVFESFNMFPVKRTRDGFTDLDRLDEMTQYVMDSLEARRTLCIFVEGVHHTDKRVLPIQKGIGRIAFTAYEKLMQPDLQIIPVGCNYWTSDKPRDVASINVGEPIFVKDYWENYQNLPAQATHQLCKDIQEALKTLCHHVNDPEDDKMAEKLLTLHRSKYPIGHYPVVQYNNDFFEREKRVTEWINTLGDDDKAKMKKKLKKYFGHIEEYNISDEALMHPEWTEVGRWIFLVLLFPLFVVGYLARWPIATFAHYAMNNFAKKKEFKSSVYLGAEFFIGMLWVALLFVISLFTGKPLLIGLAAALPVLYWFSNIYREVADRTFKALRALQHPERKQLLSEREKL